MTRTSPYLPILHVFLCSRLFLDNLLPGIIALAVQFSHGCPKISKHAACFQATVPVGFARPKVESLGGPKVAFEMSPETIACARPTRRTSFIHHLFGAPTRTLCASWIAQMLNLRVEHDAVSLEFRFYATRSEPRYMPLR